MRIVQCSLNVRFYTSDKWNRSAVAECLESKNIHKVIPRWFNDEKDRLVVKRGSANVIEDDQEYLDCDYYAVYDLTEKFDNDVIGNHEYVSMF